MFYFIKTWLDHYGEAKTPEQKLERFERLMRAVAMARPHYLS